MRQPSSGKVAFFVMTIGHSFGLVAAVYNYNRRSAAITDILRRLFFVAAFNFYDDKYGFEPEATCSSAFEVSQKVHWWLGAQFDPKKLQLCFDPTILGVTYDLKAMHLKIKPSRKEELLDEIEAIINSQVFSTWASRQAPGKIDVRGVAALGEDRQGVFALPVRTAVHKVQPNHLEQGDRIVARTLEVAPCGRSTPAYPGDEPQVGGLCPFH